MAIICIALYFHKPIIKYSFRAYRWYARKHNKGKISPADFPMQYEVHGIDVSHYQPDIDWEHLASIATNGDTVRFQFVFIKATEGAWWEDELFAEHWENAKDNHIIRGAYHYFLPNKDAKKQAKNFIESVDLEKGDLPPVIDIEETKGMSKEAIVKAVKDYAIVIEQRYNVKPIIYSNRNFIEDYLAEDFPDYTFWIAHYYEQDLNIDECEWRFWQHTDKASLLSTGAKIDANVFNGNQKELNALLIKDKSPSFRQN